MKKIFTIALAVVLFAVTGCTDDFEIQGTSEQNKTDIPEYVNINFSLVLPEFAEAQTQKSVMNSRKAIPDSNAYENMTYVLTGVAGESTAEEKIASWSSLSQLRNANVRLHTGEWKFTLTVYAQWNSSSSDEANAQYVVLRDTKEVTLTQGATLSFTLREIENCNVKGSLRFTVNYSSSTGWSVNASLLNAADFSETSYTPYCYINSNYTEITCSGILSGNYLLKIQFVYTTGGESFESYTMPLVQIAAGLTTTGSKTLNADELTRFYSICYSYIEEGSMPAGYATTYTPYKSCVLENPTRTNYKFEGWYYDYNFTESQKLPVNAEGKYVFNQNHDLTGDVYIYAKWLRTGYEQNGFEWHLSDDGVLTISGEGEVPFSSVSFQEWQNATSVVVEEGITGFVNNYYSSANGFSNNYRGDEHGNSRNIKNITLPSTLVYIQSYCFHNCTALETINIPEGVTSIGNYAFSGCTSLKALTLPEGLTTIGQEAFKDCVSISSITVPLTVTTLYRDAFRGWKENQAIAFDWNSDDTTTRTINNISSNYSDGPNAHCKDGKAAWFSWVLDDDGVLRVRGNGDVPFASFEEWRNATSVVVEEGITGFSDSNFAGHNGFSNRYNQNTQNIKNIILPSTLTSIPIYCFHGCTALEAINIPNSVESIGSCAFQGCTNLKTVRLPENLTLIESFLFINCTALENISIPDGVTSISEYAFQNCTSLESITVPESVTTLYRSAFSGWTDEQEITLDWSGTDGHTIINNNDYSVGPNAHFRNGKAAWYSWSINDEGVLRIRGEGELPFTSYSWKDKRDVTTVVVEEGITSFGYDSSATSAFTNSGIKNVILPSTLIEISRYCFENCTSLEAIEIPESVTSIGYEAFRNCSSLTELTIPAGVTKIDSYAFAYCTGISSITVPATVTTRLDKNIFEGWQSNQSIILDWNSNDSTHTMPYTNSIIYQTHAKYHNGVYAWNGCALNDDGTVVISGSGTGTLYYNDPLKNSKYTSIVVQEGITSLQNHNNTDYEKDYPYIKTVSLPSTLTTLGNYALANLSGVEALTIPESVTSLGTNVFDQLGIKTITIPSGITTIPVYAFSGCVDLESVILHSEITSIGERAFYLSAIKNFALPSSRTSISKGAFEGSSIETVDLNTYADAIPENCFNGCNSLTTVAGTSAITSVGKNAFRECTALSSITLPETCTSIAEYAFYKCTGFETLTIPASVTSIGTSAFDYCTSGQTIILDWNADDATQRTIATDAFGYAGVTVKYKDGSLYGE